jgi:hypothetical protein
VHEEEEEEDEEDDDDDIPELAEDDGGEGEAAGGGRRTRGNCLVGSPCWERVLRDAIGRNIRCTCCVIATCVGQAVVAV